jgi:catechol 2,3-dioxygenase-like lactoylglutathione lyase family enzyme
MILPTETTPEAGPGWQGIHHIALVTPDLAATLHFYQDVLGLKLTVLLPAGEGHGRHAILSAGGTGLGLHFFEDATAQIFTHPDALGGLRFISGALQHIALALPDEEAGQALLARLQELGIQTTAIMEQARHRSFGLLDNMGLMLEVAWFKPATEAGYR